MPAELPEKYIRGTLLYLLLSELKYFLFLLSFLVGLSRVYVGVHYPIDILGSFLICIIVAKIYATIASWSVRQSSGP